MVMSVCRKEISRCGKCAGRQGTEDCVVSVDKVACVNCRGDHATGDWKCPVLESQVDLIFNFYRSSHLTTSLQ
jgi:hypothetical protein